MVVLCCPAADFFRHKEHCMLKSAEVFTQFALVLWRFGPLAGTNIFDNIPLAALNLAHRAGKEAKTHLWIEKQVLIDIYNMSKFISCLKLY